MPQVIEGAEQLEAAHRQLAEVAREQTALRRQLAAAHDADKEEVAALQRQPRPARLAQLVHPDGGLLVRVGQREAAAEPEDSSRGHRIPKGSNRVILQCLKLAQHTAECRMLFKRHAAAPRFDSPRAEHRVQ